jgi:hypothetical protein
LRFEKEIAAKRPEHSPRVTKKRQFMPLPAEKAAPLLGVKGAKPRLRQPKVARRPGIAALRPQYEFV